MIVLVLCLNVSLIASGGKEAPSEGPISIQYWHYQPTPIRKEIEAENIKLFEERNPGITVEYVPVPWEKAHAKYITSVAAGNAADVGMIPDFWISEFAAMGALENLESFIAQWEHKDDYIPLALSDLLGSHDRGSYRRPAAGDGAFCLHPAVPDPRTLLRCGQGLREPPTTAHFEFCLIP